jgi:hypothetical protein
MEEKDRITFDKDPYLRDILRKDPNATAGRFDPSHTEAYSSDSR